MRDRPRPGGQSASSRRGVKLGFPGPPEFVRFRAARHLAVGPRPPPDRGCSATRRRLRLSLLFFVPHQDVIITRTHTHTHTHTHTSQLFAGCPLPPPPPGSVLSTKTGSRAPKHGRLDPPRQASGEICTSMYSVHRTTPHRLYGERGGGGEGWCGGFNL